MSSIKGSTRRMIKDRGGVYGKTKTPRNAGARKALAAHAKGIRAKGGRSALKKAWGY